MDAGLGIGRGARALGISQSTWAHYARQIRAARPKSRRPLPPFVLDAQGEKVSTPPGRVYHRCETCGGRESPDHPHRHAA